MRIKLYFDMSLPPNVVILQSKALRGLFSIIRDKSTPPLRFAQIADRIARLLVEEGIAELPAEEISVETPCGLYPGVSIPHNICGVSIVRAGDSLLNSLRSVDPSIAVGKILIQRDETHPDKIPKLFYCKLPPDVASRYVLLCDPMLATGGSCICAISKLVEAGVPQKNIVFLNVVSCPEGLWNLNKAYPDVKVVTAAVDSHLNEHKYIVPGLGDYGDRYYNTIA